MFCISAEVIKMTPNENRSIDVRFKILPNTIKLIVNINIDINLYSKKNNNKFTAIYQASGNIEIQLETILNSPGIVKMKSFLILILV